MNLTIQDAIVDVMPNALGTGITGSTLMTSVCSFQEPSGVIVDGGSPDGIFVPVSGMQNIPCTKASPSTMRVQGTEAKSATQILGTLPFHVLLGGYFPQIVDQRVSDWQAIIDGVLYDILGGGEADSQSQMTRMEVRIATI